MGIVNAVVLNATNARAEGLNAVIQKLKARACGYRNRERFKNAILCWTFTPGSQLPTRNPEDPLTDVDQELVRLLESGRSPGRPR